MTRHHVNSGVEIPYRVAYSLNKGDLDSPDGVLKEGLASYSPCNPEE